MRNAESIMAEMAEAKFFTKLDASSGYWQIKADEESSKLLKFNTPFGRYKFKRLPFGILSASEVFQKKIVEIIDGISGCANVQDDIIVWGKTRDEHDLRLSQTLERITKSRLKLNKEKCVFGATEMTFLGHIFSDDRVKPDPAKVKAITDMPTPTNKTELQRFLRMVTYLGKFIPDLSSKTTSLRQLLESSVEWHWTEHQDQAITQVKKEISSSPTLKYYDPKLETMVSVDASKYELGAVLLQKHKSWDPVAYASRSLTKTEQNYAQIEKETMAIVFGTQRFHDYIYGKHFTVESDHKPLQPIFSKPIANAPPRIQRFRLKLQKYDMTIQFTPGRNLPVADALSRAYLPQLPEDELNLESQVHMVLSNLPISDKMLNTFQTETDKDQVLQKLRNVLSGRWPHTKTQLPNELTSYFTF